MLKIKHITTGYGKKQVLSDLSFSVDRGDIVLLSGGNGSGKSTVLKTIYGLLNPWTPDGKVIFEGKEITVLPVSAMIKRRIVYMPQKKNVFEDFTVEENLYVSAGIYSKEEATKRVGDVLEILPILKTIHKRTPFHLSGGEKQILAFGNMLIHSPKLALLDEPLAGVDAANSEILIDCIAAQHKNDATFVIVEHKKHLLRNIVNKEFELELGTIKKQRI